MEGDGGGKGGLKVGGERGVVEKERGEWRETRGGTEKESHREMKGKKRNERERDKKRECE